MNWDQLETEWKNVKNQVRSRWAKLSDEDLKNLGAKKEHLVGKIQERYGIMKDDAERQVDEWLAKLSMKGDDKFTPPTPKDPSAGRSPPPVPKP